MFIVAIAFIFLIVLAFAFRAFLFLFTWALGLVSFVAMLFHAGDSSLIPVVGVGVAILLESIRPKFLDEETEEPS